MFLGIMNRAVGQPEKDKQDLEFDAAEAGLVVAAHEMFKAIEDDDPAAFARAFHSAFMCCESVPHKEANDEDEDEDDENEGMPSPFVSQMG